MKKREFIKQVIFALILIIVLIIIVLNIYAEYSIE